MSAREQRRLRHAVAQLAACNDEDIAWIMDTLTETQREHLTSLIESVTPIPVTGIDTTQAGIEAVFTATPAFLIPRFRQAIEQGTGEGHLTESTRAVLAAALRDVSARVPTPVAGRSRPRERIGARFGRWLGLRK